MECPDGNRIIRSLWIGKTFTVHLTSAHEATRALLLGGCPGTDRIALYRLRQQPPMGAVGKAANA